MQTFPFRFGNYDLIDLLTTGETAEVFRARVAGQDLAQAKVIAVKRILSGFSGNQEFVRSFQKESGLAMGLNHPNIGKVFDVGAVEGQCYVAMEYVHGKSLQNLEDQCAAKGIHVPVSFTCHVIREIGGALSYVHNLRDKVSGKFAGIVHREVSPQNVMLSYSGAVKLLDFGGAKVMDRDQTNTGTFLGKPAYMSPEQAAGEELDPRSDLFSLGVLFWEMLTGNYLFLEDQPIQTLKNVVERPIPPPSSINPQVPAEVDAVVMRCLERNRDARYQSAQELQADLDPCLAALTPAFDKKLTAEMLRLAFGTLIDRENDQLAAKMMAQPPSAASVAAGSLEVDLSSGATQEWKRNYVDKVLHQEPSRTNLMAPPPERVSFGYTAADSRSSWSSVALLGIALAACAGGGWWWLKKSHSSAAARSAAAEAVSRVVASTAVPDIVLDDPLQVQTCSAGSSPVCAFASGHATSFDNSCAAAAAKAVPLYDGKCDPAENPVPHFKSISLVDGWRATRSTARAATFGDRVEIELDGKNLPMYLHFQIVLIAAGSGREVKSKDMATNATVMSLDEQLAAGAYDFEVRAKDGQGNLIFKERSNQPFEFHVPADVLPRRMVL